MVVVYSDMMPWGCTGGYRLLHEVVRRACFYSATSTEVKKLCGENTSSSLILSWLFFSSLESQHKPQVNGLHSYLLPTVDAFCIVLQISVLLHQDSGPD